MLTGRAALASVYLCFFCLTTLTHQSTDSNCVQDLLRQIQTVQQLLQHDAPEMLNSMLYTPTISDFQKCPRTAMQCFADELKVLLEEWDLIKGVGNLGLDKELKALKLDQTNSNCTQCELFKVERAETFLKGLERTLNYIMDGPGVC